MDIKNLKDILENQYKAQTSWYSINGPEAINCINMKSKNDLFDLYYIDERGIVEYVGKSLDESEACDLFLLEFEHWYRYNILKESLFSKSMKLNWSESHLIIALRVLFPFFKNKGFSLSAMEYGGRDGDYIEFSHCTDNITCMIQYNPEFDIVIKRHNWLRCTKISLVEKKDEYIEFSHLKKNFNGVEELEELLQGYLDFIEKCIS